MELYGRVDPQQPNIPWALWRRVDDGFGIPELDLVAPPSRFFIDQDHPPSRVRSNIDARRAARVSSLLERIDRFQDWNSGESGRLLGKLSAWFLVCEDRQDRLTARPVQTLAHQASLVRFILDSPNHRKVLIGDEVGLGKTIEAGLLLKELLERNPRLRVCYFAPARLVTNVYREFDLLNLSFRKWNSDLDSDANLDRDDRIIASIHRASHEAHTDAWAISKPWDILIVDECHHLSNYDPEGYGPKRQYALIQSLIERQPPAGRLILMSGTPHQGNPERFVNLLRLLSDDRNKPQHGADRVIFRTKEDVRDWRGAPLFPGRVVNPPRVMNAPQVYYEWMRLIHRCYQGGVAGSQAQQRAGGWRAALALQWAASSIQAGLAFLVRTALRAGWQITDPNLLEAAAALRPYRLGPVDEPPESVISRMRRALGNSDEDEEDDDRWTPNRDMLLRLLAMGNELLEKHCDDKWDFIFSELVSPAGQSQIVFFAQPIETVCAFANYLQRRHDQRPSIIIGGQEQLTRDGEVARFWNGQSQFLIGSRAAYEGFNLQCAHRLVHMDIPWNPMDLEQRIGRVHRFGSRKTIQVDSVVTQRSREADAYGTAYNRLREIAGALAPDEERMQLLFARIMNLIPPDELQAVLLTRPVEALSVDEKNLIAQMVDRGLKNWSSFHDTFKVNQEAIAQLDPGQADWPDLVAFLEQHAKAVSVDGYSSEGFLQNESKEIVQTSEPVSVLKFPYQGAEITAVCEDVAGRPVSDGKGTYLKQLGINLPYICELLRKQAFPDQPAELGFFRLRPEQRIGHSPFRHYFDPPAVLAVATRVSVRREVDNSVSEVGRHLQIWNLSDDSTRPLDDHIVAWILRQLPNAVHRRESITLEAIRPALITWLQGTLMASRRPDEEERLTGISHVVFPLGLIHVE